MITRLLASTLKDRLAESPAVALLGPRQSGKTTLALEVGKELDALYLDLESEADRARLAEPELYLSGLADRLVILDEVHRAPGLFPVLRGLIDRARRRGHRTGQFLLLGSAALDLLKQSGVEPRLGRDTTWGCTRGDIVSRRRAGGPPSFMSGETLAGRIAYLELGPFHAMEVRDHPLDELWLRGGFPDSLLASSLPRSLRWRQDFIRTYLERDIPQFGPRIAAETLRRFWTMLAHHQGGLLNTAQFARNLGVDAKTANGYLDLLVDLLLVRRLPPWHANVGKRLVKSPKVYVRDSGLLHALLGLTDLGTLLSHPVVGASWEGFVIETLLSVVPEGVTASFYRTGGGAEMDLLLAWPDDRLWAIEIKRSLSPKVERGFHSACSDLRPERRFVVYPGEAAFPLAASIEALPLRDLAARLIETGL